MSIAEQQGFQRGIIDQIFDRIADVWLVQWRDQSMRKDETKIQDELRPEYDLRTLQVRKIGAERTHLKNKKTRWKGCPSGFCFRGHSSSRSKNE